MRAEIEGRPALGAAIGLVLGLFALSFPWLWAVLAIAVLWIRPIHLRGALSIAFILGLALAPRTVLPERASAPIPVLESGDVLAPVVRYENAYAANVSTPRGQVRLSTDHPIRTGDFIAFRGEMLPLREGTERYASHRMAVGRVAARGADLEILRPSTGLQALASRWRESFIEFSDGALDGPDTAAVRALSFNLDEGLDKDFRDNLQRTGTIHIISASGAHVLILAATVFALASLLPVSRAMQILLVLSVLTVYAFAAGFEPPIVRAVLMAALALGAYGVRREPDWLSALSIALMAYLVWDPSSIHDIGLQLSFATVAGMALCCQAPTSRERGLAGWIWEWAKTSLHVSAVAWISSLPLVAYHFGQISLIAPAANLPIAALAGPVLSVSLIAHGLWFVVPPLGVGAMVGIVGPLSSGVRWFVDTMGALPFASIGVPELPVWAVAASYGVLLVVWRRRAVRP